VPEYKNQPAESSAQRIDAGDGSKNYVAGRDMTIVERSEPQAKSLIVPVTMADIKNYDPRTRKIIDAASNVRFEGFGLTLQIKLKNLLFVLLVLLVLLFLISFRVPSIHADVVSITHRIFSFIADLLH